MEAKMRSGCCHGLPDRGHYEEQAEADRRAWPTTLRPMERFLHGAKLLLIIRTAIVAFIVRRLVLR